MKKEKSNKNRVKLNRKRWLAYAAVGAATSGALVATTDEVCADIIVRRPAASLLPGDTTAGPVLGGSGMTGSRARFSTSLNGNGLIVLDAIHPMGFGRLLGRATEGVRFFGEQITTTFATAGVTYSNRFNFPANAALGARFSTLQTRSDQLSSGPRTSIAGYDVTSQVAGLADPAFIPTRTNDQFGQTYLATTPTSQDAYLTFTFDDAAGQQFGFIRLNQVTPGLTVPVPAGAPQFGLNGFVVEEVAFTTEGQLDLDRGFAVGVIPTAVPEPGSMAVLALGAIGLAAWRRRKISKIDQCDSQHKADKTD